MNSTSPFNACAIILEQYNPTPILLSWSSFSDFIYMLCFNSPNSLKSWGILSCSIPIPSSVITVLKSISFGFAVDMRLVETLICPYLLLYFTAFWIMLKIISWYKRQSVLMEMLCKFFLLMFNFIFLLLIWYSKGWNTYSINISGFFEHNFLILSYPFFIFIFSIWFVL